MPPPSKHVKHMRELAQKAGAAVKISEEARAAHKARPPIVMQGSKDLQLSVVRHEKPRRAQKEANDAWLRACEAWPQLQLKCIVGNAENPEGDYGAVGTLFEFKSREYMPANVTRSGVCFLGLPSCKKKGQSTEFVCVCARVLAALYISPPRAPFSRMLPIPYVHGSFTLVVAHSSCSTQTRS